MVDNLYMTSEHKYNNYYAYPEEYKQEHFAKNMEIKKYCQGVVSLAYFKMPFESESLLFYPNDSIKYFSENLFQFEYVPFFLHPYEGKNMAEYFPQLEYVPPEKSEFKGLLTSSSRTFILFYKNTPVCQIKLSLFQTVSKGSRHITFFSACEQVKNCTLLKMTGQHRISGEIFDLFAVGVKLKYKIHIPDTEEVHFGSREVENIAQVWRRLPKNLNSTISFASFMSKEFFVEIKNYVKNKGITYKQLFNGLVLNNMFNAFFNVYLDTGICVEPHCQNVLLELNEDIIKSKVLYRDFDISAIDRARLIIKHPDWFMFRFKAGYAEYLTPEENKKNIIGVIYSFINHFFYNLILPFTFSLKINDCIDTDCANQILLESYQYIRERLRKKLHITNIDRVIKPTPQPIFEEVNVEYECANLLNDSFVLQDNNSVFDCCYTLLLNNLSPSRYYSNGVVVLMEDSNKHLCGLQIIATNE